MKKSPKAKKTKGFTPEERQAMKEYVQELKGAKVEGAEVVLAKIATMKEPDRTMAKRLHTVVMASAPNLVPRTWYGMPAYAQPGKDGKVVCFFQGAHKFKTRYATFGFSDKANLDDGNMWANGFALKELGAAEEAKIAALVKKAVG
ncbi:MAG TPA: DUF1801 domain-containing protein [Gemmatimonadales bacterium]|jgi:uncharacterized protein YdhG (YjbR/CyaY superfamily)|nr:DUF1801 domain-containing protein [Gemmatimonadales bacterium]